MPGGFVISGYSPLSLLDARRASSQTLLHGARHLQHCCAAHWEIRDWWRDVVFAHIATELKSFDAPHKDAAARRYHVATVDLCSMLARALVLMPNFGIY